MHFTLRQLAYFVAAAEHGNITRAANEIGLSQPALSAAIKELESNLELSLILRRASHGFTLTSVGRQFLSEARILLENAHEMEMRVTGLGSELTGELRVGCFLPIAPFVISPIIAELKARHPGISVNIIEGDLEEMTYFLRHGTTDIAITYDLHMDKGIFYEKLVEISPYVLLPAVAPWTKKKSISLHEIVDMPMVLMDLPTTREHFLSLFASHGLHPKVHFSPKTYEMTRSLVAGGAGFSTLYLRPVKNISYNGTALLSLPIKEKVPNTRMMLGVAHETRPLRIVSAFAEVCRDVFRDGNDIESFFVRD